MPHIVSPGVELPGRVLATKSGHMGSSLVVKFSEADPDPPVRALCSSFLGWLGVGYRDFMLLRLGLLACEGSNSGGVQSVVVGLLSTRGCLPYLQATVRAFGPV